MAIENKRVFVQITSPTAERRIVKYTISPKAVSLLIERQSETEAVIFDGENVIFEGEQVIS